MAACSDPTRWRHLEPLLTRGGASAQSTFEPSTELLDLLRSHVRVLVVGAGGLGCELLKDLALCGFRGTHVIDMDTIDVSNLNRQFLFTATDVGQPKAVVAARSINARIPDADIVPCVPRVRRPPQRRRR